MHQLLEEVSVSIKNEGTIFDRAIGLFSFYNLPETAEHVQNVASQAAKLASAYGVNAKKAEIAGILHDISVIIPNDKRVDLADSLDINLCDEEREFPMIIHQKLSKDFAIRLFGVKDKEILNAISCHTTLRANPTKLDMIVFLADKISWDQEGLPPYLDQIMKGLDVSLEQGTFNFIDYLMKDKKNLKVVHPWLADAFNHLSENLKEIDSLM